MSQTEKLLQLVEDYSDSPELQSEAGKIVRGELEVSIPKELEVDESQEEAEKNIPLYSLIKDMKMAQKIKLAIFGNQSARAILIRDPNKLISLFVLQNARITENEIVEFSRNKDLGELVLREIANNGTWMKSYPVKLNIAGNPKVPAALALKWLGHLHDKDLQKISKSRDVPQVVATQAKRLLAKKS
jgi:hypothetical protein